jgi:hypothetical protein
VPGPPSRSSGSHFSPEGTAAPNASAPHSPPQAQPVGRPRAEAQGHRPGADQEDSAPSR